MALISSGESLINFPVEGWLNEWLGNTEGSVEGKVEEMEAHLRKHGESIVGKLLEGKNQPAAVRAVEIPKASGGKRLLGIPSVIDRMIQQAIHQEMGRTFEEGFSESSYPG